ncbi:hypothetical protein [Hansschlegelia sp.]|uniref:hypothetical protein n=1 Tax=Hansschlegelia sp. TaxID=2041892 RepID=UPI002C914083|nr:hypothetical protein [Hansschlegelia sp.]HVI27418.1 hypothetical protein [Hansschlegelia sp.]
MNQVEEALATYMTAQGAVPDPLAMALCAKSMLVDLPLALALETVRFNVRAGTCWFEHVGRMAELTRPESLLASEPPARIASAAPRVVASRAAA